MALYQPTQNELREAPQRFRYELEMFRVSVANLSNLPPGQRPFLQNLLLETALLHARNLLDFFCGTPSQRDDILAGHFVRGTGGNFWTSSKLGHLNSIKSDINKALSHLTYTRVSQKPMWHFQRISNEIEDAYKEFCSLLPQNERPKWVV